MTTQNRLNFLSLTAVVAILLETATALNTRLMAREEAADTNGCSSEDLHGGTEQQSCVLQHGDGASEYRLLRAEEQNLQENLSDVNTGNKLYHLLNVCFKL